MKTRTTAQIQNEIASLREIIDRDDGLESWVAYISECALYWAAGKRQRPTTDVGFFSDVIRKKYLKKK